MCEVVGTPLILLAALCATCLAAVMLVLVTLLGRRANALTDLNRELSGQRCRGCAVSSDWERG